MGDDLKNWLNEQEKPVEAKAESIIEKNNKKAKDSTDSIKKGRWSTSDFWSMICIVCFAAFVIILIYKGYVWLSTGNWPALSMSPVWNTVLPDSFWHWLTTDTWVGFKKILIWILKLDVTSFCLTSGVATMILSAISD